MLEEENNHVGVQEEWDAYLAWRGTLDERGCDLDCGTHHGDFELRISWF
jgi:hypothetical protein